jgi:hypothetical protein
MRAWLDAGVVTVRRLGLAVLASAGGGLLLSGVHPLGAAGVGVAVAIVVRGLGISPWRLSKGVDQL